MQRISLTAIVFLIAITLSAASPSSPRINGERWFDSEGRLINAHGGGIIFSEGKYWWYGEQRPDRRGEPQIGVSCYSSPDLREWTFEGTVLSPQENDTLGVVPGCIMERPKVVFNEKTKQYVMWFHHELKGQGYAAAQAGVAVADNPRGPFRMIRSARVNPGILPLDLHSDSIPENISPDHEWWTPEWLSDVADGLFVYRDLPGGQMARDMTIFVDDNGKAYHIYSSEENLTLHIAELTDDYTAHTGKYIRIFPGGHNEAPALFKKDGKYWMIASGCTGWAPNEARLMCADDIMGPWTRLPNPCKGENAEKTFLGQSAFVLTLPGVEDSFIAVFDRWNPDNLMDSRYLWLPVSFTGAGTPEIIWTETF